MNNQRNDELRNNTMKLLARLNAPRAVQGNTDALKTEAQFLVDRVIKLAPSRQYTDWFVDFEEALLTNLESRTWPTAKEISKAAKDIAPKRPEIRDDTQPKGYEPDELKINAKRIHNKEEVGENYIFGTMAEQMVRKGLVTQEQLQPYREYLNNMKRG
tara:strand:- start:184 stop:657 length:474 start_codon:yes stop_codon:yes gene_type:complete